MFAVEPEGSPVLSGGDGGPHMIQGSGGFIPENMSPELMDEAVLVSNDQAFDTARRLARMEGIPVGISSGAALCAGLVLRAGLNGWQNNRRDHPVFCRAVFVDGSVRWALGRCARCAIAVPPDQLLLQPRWPRRTNASRSRAQLPHRYSWALSSMKITSPGSGAPMRSRVR